MTKAAATENAVQVAMVVGVVIVVRSFVVAAVVSKVAVAVVENVRTDF